MLKRIQSIWNHGFTRRPRAVCAQARAFGSPGAGNSIGCAPASRFLAVLVVSALSAGPVMALSCAPFSAQQAFQIAEASPDPYVIVRGKLSFNPADLPLGFDERGGGPTAETLFSASLVGFSLTAAGFNNRFIRNIKVHAACYGPWCASLNSGEDYLLFLKKVDRNYLLEITPCPGLAFPNPSAEVLNDIHQCLLGEACAPRQYER